VARRRDRRRTGHHGWRGRHRPDRRLGSRIDGAAACGGRPDFDGNDHHLAMIEGATLFAVVVGMMAVLK
jgi:hypothetical protein